MFAVIIFLLPLAFKSGFVAYLLWVFATVFSPQLYLYGFMEGFRYVFVFAGVALLTLWMHKEKRPLSVGFDGTSILLLLFVSHAIISSIFALQPNPLVLFRIDVFLKGMVLAVAAPYFLTSRWKIHLTLIVIVAGLGFHAVLDGLKVIASGGGHNTYGISNSTLSDNNLYALGIVMLLPLILYLVKYSGGRLAKLASLGTFVLCVLTVVGSNSRGAFLALAILGVWYWITSSRKMISALVIAFAFVGVIQIAPERWFDRIETIKTAGEDESFLGRVAAWKVSLNIANDHPLLGGGFQAVQTQWIWNRYKDTPNLIPIDVPEMTAKAAHSNYFQVLGDLGYVGLLLFIALMASAFVTRWKIQRLASTEKTNSAWATDLATSINLSVVAFMAGGAGVSLAYFELAYLMIMIQCSVRRILLAESAPSKAAIDISSVNKFYV